MAKKNLLVELTQQTNALTKKDIRDWRNAWQMAIDTERPYRNKLLDIYDDIVTDGHISGAIEQRKKMVLQKPYKITNPKNGEEIPDALHIFQSQWFADAMDIMLEARFYGHSLIQLGDVREDRFDGAILVPRRHIVPELGVITREPGDDPSTGIPYREKFANWVIEAGKPNDLGLLLKCAPHAISKKNMAAFWDQFGEMFGMPIRIAKTQSRDPKEVAKIDNMMESMGARAWARFAEDTEIEFQETERGDAFNVYDKRIERANTEISKLLLGQTMTMDNGSSKSQSETHLTVLQNIVNSDAAMLRHIINDQVIPLCRTHGLLKTDAVFQWDEPLNYTADEQLRLEQMLLSRYEINPDYFVKKYNIPITGEKATPQPGDNQLRLDQTDFFA